MIRHIVFFKLTENSEKNKKILKQKILALKKRIDVIKNMEVGLNFSPEERAYDLVLIADFNTKEDLQNYATNPTHLKLIENLKSSGATSKVVDYEL